MPLFGSTQETTFNAHTEKKSYKKIYRFNKTQQLTGEKASSRYTITAKICQNNGQCKDYIKALSESEIAYLKTWHTIKEKASQTPSNTFYACTNAVRKYLISKYSDGHPAVQLYREIEAIIPIQDLFNYHESTKHMQSGFTEEHRIAEKS